MDAVQPPQSFLDNMLDAAGQPKKSLKAHPPTSGKEPMLLLGPKNKPMIDIVVHTYKLDYYDCQGVVGFGSWVELFLWNCQNPNGWRGPLFGERGEWKPPNTWQN